MIRLKKILSGLALLALGGVGSLASAQLQGAGTLFVDLRADDLTTQSTVSQWTNHGTAGLSDFFETRTLSEAALNIPSPTVGQFDNTRGVYFDEPRKGLMMGAVGGGTIVAPAGLTGDSDFTYEAWIWSNSVTNVGLARPVIAVGDRGTNVGEADYGGNGGGPGYSWVSYGTGGDHSLGSGTNFNGRWHYMVWSYTGSAGTPVDTMTVYEDGVSIQTWVGPNNIHGPTVGNGTGNIAPGAPISIGAVRNSGSGVAGAGFWDNGQNFSQVSLAGINRVRIWDGALTAAQVLNNYNFEKAEFVPLVNPPLNIVEWRKPLSGSSAGKVMEFGDLAPGTGGVLSKDFQYTNLTSAAFTANSYSIIGPDAARYKITPTTQTVANGLVGSIPINGIVNFSIQFTPTTTAETSATLVVNTSIGTTRIWLRANVARIYVATTGDDTNGNGTAGNPYLTIAKAISVAKPGSVINLADGTYGSTTIGNIPEGDHQVRINSPTSNVILINTSGTSNNFISDMIAAPQPPGVSFPLVNPAGIRNSTITFENITFDNRNSGTAIPINGSGTGTFDLTLNNCKVFNLNGAYAFGTNNLAARYVRLSATNSTIYGANRTVDLTTIPPTPARQNPAIEGWGGAVEVNLNGCDLRQSNRAVEVSSTVLPAKITMNNCQAGTDSNANDYGPNATGVANTGILLIPQLGGSATSVDGDILTVTGCVFDGFSRRAVDLQGVTSQLIMSGCTVRNCASRGVIMSNTTSSVLAFSALGASSITDSVFSNPLAFRDIDLQAGMTANITNTTISSNNNNPASLRDAGIIISPGVVSVSGGPSPHATTNPTVISIVGCTIDTGTTASTAIVTPAAHDTGAIVVLVGYRTYIKVDRSTLLAKFLTTGGNTRRGSGIVLEDDDDVAASPREPNMVVTNTLIEGGSYGIRFGFPRIVPANPANTVPPAPNAGELITLINDTIIAANDIGTSVALQVVQPAICTATIQNCIVLGYTALTNATTLIANHNFVSGDPKFVNPATFVLPTTIGVNDYRLTFRTPAGPGGILGQGVPVTIAAPVSTPPVYPAFTPTNIDRNGVNRAAVGRIDVGAFEFNPPPNPVKQGWTWY